VVERSKANVCGCAFAGIAGSNPAGDMSVCVVCCRGISDMRIKYIKIQNVQKVQNEREKIPDVATGIFH
jgi:hypothetical protein